MILSKSLYIAYIGISLWMWVSRTQLFLLKLRFCIEYPISLSKKHLVLQLLKIYWEKKRRSSPRIFNNPLLKYRRQFYIRNPKLFLNYSNYFYIFFLFCTFASGTLSYYLFFPRPSTFRSADKHAWKREDTRDSEARNFTRNMTIFSKF